MLIAIWAGIQDPKTTKFSQKAFYVIGSYRPVAVTLQLPVVNAFRVRIVHAVGYTGSIRQPVGDVDSKRLVREKVILITGCSIIVGSNLETGLAIFCSSATKFRMRGINLVINIDRHLG